MTPDTGTHMPDASHPNTANPADSPALLTLEEAARVLQCHRTTIGRLVAQGELACIRYSSRPGSRMLFTTELLTDFLRRRAVRTPPPITCAPSSRKRTLRADQRSPWEAPTPTSDQLW